MILYSAAHSGLFFYWVQVLIIDRSRKLEQLLTDLRLTLQTSGTNELTSLFLCVCCPWERPESKWKCISLSIRNISEGLYDSSLLIYSSLKELALTCVPLHVKDAVTICTLGIGTAFGESILDNTPRHATIVTREFSELLRIEQKDFRSLWEVWKFTESIAMTPIWITMIEVVCICFA